MIVRFAPLAEADLRAAVDHIARDNPATARKMGERIVDVIEQLASGDFDGPRADVDHG